MGAVSVVLLLLDSLFRRLLIPLALLSAIIFRYNVFSLVYLLFFIILLLVPSPRLKSQKYVSMLVLVLLMVSSLLFLLGQAFFQFSLLITSLSSCSSWELSLRQLGVVQLAGVSVANILRLMLVDVGVFVVTLIAVIINGLLLRSYRKRVETEGVEEEGSPNLAGVESQATELRLEERPSQGEGEMHSISSGVSVPSYDPAVQCYWRVPVTVMYSLRILIFVLLGLAGIAVPSVTSGMYFLSCLFLLIIWSLHRTLASVIRVLSIILVFYSSAHLIVLDLYQLQSAQNYILQAPVNSTTRLLARLFGLTPVIMTACGDPTTLHVYPGLNFVNYMSPGLILALMWVLSTDCRFWLSTPSKLWKEHGRYFIPITDHPHTPPTIVRVAKGRDREYTTQYGATMDGQESSSLLESRAAFVIVRKPKRVLEVWHKVWEGIVLLWDLIFSISFIFAIVAMMVWSVVYPSWPSLVFLLWACGIWLFPKATPREAVLWTSPLLVVYSTLLLLLQYVFSLNVGDVIPRYSDLLPECKSGLEEGCSSLVLLGKTCLTIVFYSAFRESVHYFMVVYDNRRQGSSSSDGEMRLLPLGLGQTTGSGRSTESPDGVFGEHGIENSIQRREQAIDKYAGFIQLVGTYWVLAVVGAFLLVILTGDPGLLKTVYLIFFFYLILTYQIAEKWWYYLNYPVWLVLIVYAVLHLLLVYTYNFEAVRKEWTKAYNSNHTINFADKGINESALYTSVGLERYNETIQSLLTTLVPPAVFIAVLALQIRYFKPASPGQQVDIKALLPGFLRNAIQNIEDFNTNQTQILTAEAVPETREEGEGDGGGGLQTVGGTGVEAAEGTDDPGTEGNEDGAKRPPSPSIQLAPADSSEDSSKAAGPNRSSPPVGTASPPTLSRQDTAQTLQRQNTYMYLSPTPSQNCLLWCYKHLSYLFNKTRLLILWLVYLTWRFLQLHLYKLIMLFLFASSVSQISVLYWLLLVIVVLLVPLPCGQRLTLPLVTTYLGLVTLAKMVYQFPVIMEDSLRFPDSSQSCEPIPVDNKSDQVFMHRFSPQGSDGNWLGLHKAGRDFARYISLPIISALLLTLWFSVNRFQRLYYKDKNIVIKPFEKGALFLNVPRADAEKNLWSAIKYWVNHFFEIYGLEVCLCMLAITVAVRVDVYGVFYAASLGLLLLVPRRHKKLLAVVWVVYLVVHGILLIVQYFFLLGIPSNPTTRYCLGSDTVYPWSSNWDNTNSTIRAVAFKKWLFLPADEDQILNRSLLYADFVVYLLFCCQVMYFFKNPLRDPSSDHYRQEMSVLDFTRSEKLLDNIKYLVFEYFFWVTLFLLFATAVIRVSILGIIYLLAIFIFLYRGEEMLKDRKKRRHFSWAALRWFSWAVLLLRVSLQIISCSLSTSGDYSNYVAMVLFNGACTEGMYYGVDIMEDLQLNNVSLWVDAFNFAVITLQIIVMDTTYTDIISEELKQKERNAARFRDIFDEIVEQTQKEAKTNRKQELSNIQTRANRLDVTGKTIDHILYGGVRIPEGIQRRSKNRTESGSHKKDNYFDIDAFSPRKKRQTTPTTDEDVTGTKVTWYVKVWNMLKKWLINSVDEFTLILEENSALYRQVVDKASSTSLVTTITPLGPDHVEEETREEDLQEVEESTQTQDEFVGSKEEGRPGKESRKNKRKLKKKIGGAKKQTKSDADKETAGAAATPPPTDPHAAAAGQEAPPTNTTALDFDHRGNLLVKELHLEPSESAQRKTKAYEDELVNQVTPYTKRMSRLLKALYYVFLSHSEYVAYFFIILNIILNGGVLSLIFAALLFGWGLLSNPWPTRAFWMTLTFYSMLVLIVKYFFQMLVLIIEHGENEKNFGRPSTGGLDVYTVLGIQFRTNFLANAAWDMVLLIALLIHRGLLKQYGLWGTYKDIASDIFGSVKTFFKTLVDSSISLGAKDYYVIMLFFDILCFVTIVLGVNSFGVGASDNITAVANFFQSNQIPIFFLAMLLMQFLSMLVDRAIYLKHSVRAKLVFQVFLLIVWHAGLFFLLPSSLITGRPFVANLAAKFLYFFKACYFIVSSFQIISGYPVRVINNFLTTRYNMVYYVAFLIYRAIPLLPEMRAVMDWSFTDTTLTLINWFRVQEIYYQLYVVKVRRDREKGSPRDLGEKQSLLIKVFMGLSLLIALVVLIWGPLVFISFISNASPPNPPTEVNVKLNLAGFEPLVQLTAQNVSISSLSSQQYGRLVEYFQNNSEDNVNVLPLFRQQLAIQNFRRIKLRGTSTALWTISPPAKQLLSKQLGDLKTDPGTSAALEFYWSISRTPQSSAVSEVVSGSRQLQLKYPNNSETIDMFLRSLNSTEETSQPVILHEMFPVVILAPASSAASIFSELTDVLRSDSQRYVTAKVTLDSMRFDNFSRQWWTITQDISESPYILGNETENNDNDFIELIIYSSSVPPPFFQSFAGLGITGLYSAIVLVIGRFIRGYISDLPFRLIIDEILYPEPLIKLCEDIFFLRESKKFKLEEIYVGKLFYIFRSPQKIIELTEEKQKTD